MRALIVGGVSGLVLCVSVVVAQAADEPVVSSVSQIPAAEPAGEPGDYGRETRTPGPGESFDSARKVVVDELSALGLTDIERAASQVMLTAADAEQGPASRVRRRWVADVALGALADRVRTTETRTVDIFPDAILVANGRSSRLGMGSVAGGQVYEPMTDAEVRDHVESVAENVGVDVRDVEAATPLGSAVSISLEVTSKKVSWTTHDLVEALQDEERAFEGLLLTIYSQDQPVAALGTAFRVGSGHTWFADGWDQILGIVTSRVATGLPTTTQAPRR